MKNLFWFTCRTCPVTDSHYPTEVSSSNLAPGKSDALFYETINGLASLVQKKYRTERLLNIPVLGTRGGLHCCIRCVGVCFTCVRLFIALV